MARKRRGKNRGARRPGVRTTTAWAPETELGSQPSVAPVMSPASGAAATLAPTPRQPASFTAPRRTGVAAAGAVIDIDARVPYFAGDLRRIGVTAGAMIVAIVVASFLLK